jgi:IS30 family transposase
MTEKRWQFLDLLAQGLSVRGAGEQLGISRASGNRWKNDARERQKDGGVRFVPPLKPLAVRNDLASAPVRGRTSPDCRPRQLRMA